MLTKIVDPNGDRSSKVTLDIQNSYRCYKDLLTVKEKNTTINVLYFFCKSWNNKISYSFKFLFIKSKKESLGFVTAHLLHNIKPKHCKFRIVQ